jgi:hypothetical protein
MAAGYSPDTTIVARPLPAAMAWLTSLFAPLRMRPMFPVEDVAVMLDVSVAQVRSFIIHYNIRLWDDPVFGELINISGLRALQKNLYGERYIFRYDRQSLIIFMCKQAGIPYNPQRSYSKKLDAEIRRICKMPEPNRTIRATALWTAWRDATTFTACMEQYRDAMRKEKGRERQQIEQGIEVLGKGIDGKIKEWKPPRLKPPTTEGDSSCDDDDSETLPEEPSSASQQTD